MPKINPTPSDADVQKLNALFKVVYADKMERLIPDDIMIQRDIKFAESDKVGEKFVQPVMLTEEQGFTYDNTANAFTIEDPIVAEYRQAAVDGVSLLLSSAISYEQAAKAANGDAKSFEAGTVRMLSALRKSVMKRLEILILYGNSAAGIGRVDTDVTIASTDTEVSLDQWADGIWAGSKNVELEVVDNSTGAVKANSALKVTAVNLETKTLTCQSLGADIGVAANDLLVFKGSEQITFDGLDKIVSTQTGEQFGINRDTYDLWRGNITDAAGADLTLDTVLNTAGKAVGRGLSGDVKLYINNRTYEKLNVSTDKDHRRIDSSYSKDKTYRGVKKLCFVYQKGLIEVTPSTFVKESDAFLIPTKVCRRIGARDVSFNTPGYEKDQVFHRMETRAGFSVRCYTHQALFVEYPAHCAKISNIKES